ncbi:MAG: NAD-dependent epimerase/dehydratase family protein [Armatimonadota bacterium]
MVILITGGAGFIGAHLCRQLIRLGHSVRVLDNLSPQVHGDHADPTSILPSEVDFVLGDVRDADAVRCALDGVDFVFHLAAETGVGQSMYQVHKYMDCNVCGTAQLLEAIAEKPDKIKRLIIASSRAVYGEGAGECPSCGEVYPNLRTPEDLATGNWEAKCPICGKWVRPIPTREDKLLNPGSVYAISKRVQEDLALCVCKAYDVPVVVLRFFNVYGSGQSLTNPYTGIITIFASRIKNGDPPLVYEDGQETRDFVHVSDVVQGCILAMGTSKADYEVVNIGSGTFLSIVEMAGIIVREFGADLQPEIIGKYRVGDIRHCTADLSKARRLLGYEPRTSFSEGIREFLTWARDRHSEDRLELATRELEQRKLFR